MSLKRQSLTLLLLVALLLTSVTVVSAQGQGTLSATVTRFLNVRILPDVQMYDYGRLETGAEVTLIGRTSDSEWVKLTTADGIVGWARQNAVTVDGDIASLPVTGVAATQGVVTRFVTLHTNPSTDSGGNVRLNQGSVVDLVAYDGEWLYVVAEDGSAGWAVPRGFTFWDAAVIDELPVVNGSVDGYAFVRVLPDVQAAAYDGRLEPGTPVTLLGRSGDSEWVQVQTLDGGLGWGTTRAFRYLHDVADLPVITYGENQAVVFNYAVLRAAPNSTSAQVGTLGRGTVVDLLLSTADRVYVKAGGSEGWAIASALAFPGGGAPELLAANATVTAEGFDSVNLREAPSVDSARLGWAAVGERLAVVGVSADGAWYRVVPASRVAAWVSANLVTLDAGVGPLLVVE